MSFTIDKIVPWGRNLAEYGAMFALTDHDLNKNILSCADGPASFNAELTCAGKRCTSVDPVYQFSSQQIRERIEETSKKIMTQLEENRDDYLWDDYKTPEKLLEIRLDAMYMFLEDFESGKAKERYVVGELPALPFADRSFDLVLSSYCLFTYSKHFSLNFHFQSIMDMCRLGDEVRIFPLLQIDGKKSPYVDPILNALTTKNIRYAIERVPYEFQKGGNQMLSIYA
jgi:hypothetical protein